MSNASYTTIATSRYRIALLLALVTAGLGGNYFRFPLFLNIDLLFGSIFAMLALQLFGIGRGIVAAAVIASLTYMLWHHPYAIIIMTAEVAVVGWLMGRFRIGMVLADTIYWLIIGMPLVYIFYQGIMNVSESDTYVTMIKQAVNGIANALLAQLIFTVFAFRSHSIQTSLKDIIYNLLAFFVLCPALIMIGVRGRADYTTTDHNIRTILKQDTERIAQSLDSWLNNRKLAVTTLAKFAATKSLQEMQSSLEQTKESDNNFLRTGLLNEEATIIAYHPLPDELGKENIGKNFADRPLIPQLKRTLKPILSEVVMGRLGDPKPMVTMLAPVITSGEYGGYVTGILSMDRVRSILDIDLKNATLYTLLDKNGNVIMSNRTDQTVMKPFVRDQGTIHRFDAASYQWIPFMPSNISIAERWKKSFYVAEITLGDWAEWKLILEQSIAPYQEELSSQLAKKLSLLFLILIGALALAEFLSRLTIKTIEQLVVITNLLPIKLASNDIKTIWPESAVLETNQLINNFREMAISLTAQFQENRQINESLEQRVEERTEEKEVLLREVHHRVKNNMAAIISLLDLQHQAMNNDSQVQMVLAELSSRIRSMSLVHEKLYSSKSFSKIDFQEYLQELISDLRMSFGSPRIKCMIDTHGVEMPLDLAVPCGMIINELILNALKYAFPNNRTDQGIEDCIVISMHNENGVFTLSVADNGVGLPPGFDLNNTATLGLSLVLMLGQHQLGGQYIIDQVGGTRFALTFSLKDGGKPYA